MGAKENILAVGVQGLVAFSSPVFAGASGRTATDYFVVAGEYLGKGFNEAIKDEQKTEQEQLELFEEERGRTNSSKATRATSPVRN